MRRRRLLAAAGALGAMMSAGEAIGAGFALQEQGPLGLGRANAGQAAAAADASTAFFNPAGLTELSRAQAAAGVHVVVPRIGLTDRGSTAATPGSLGAAVAVGGGDGGNPAKPTPIGSLYGVWPMPDGQTWLALALNAPFGLGVKYDDGWFGRYDSTESRLTVLDMAPTLARRITDWLSIGAGLDVQHANAKLANAVPNPLAAGGPTAATDGLFRAQGTSTAVGVNVGVLIKPDGATRIGLHYRSAITHELAGTAVIAGLTGALAGNNGPVKFKGDLNLPDMATLGAAFDVTDRLTLLGHVSWTGWSAFKEIRFRFADGRADAVTPAHYRDTWSAAVGAEFALSRVWQIRTGFEFDETPTVDGFRDTRVPDGNRYWIAAGTSYEIADRITVDVAYAHLFVEHGPIDVTHALFAGTAAASSARVVGVADSAIDIFSAGLRYVF
ncbi:MAG: outer membrane protein transport protein [Alphaproteobacteria bacterium]